MHFSKAIFVGLVSISCVARAVECDGFFQSPTQMTLDRALQLFKKAFPPDFDRLNAQAVRELASDNDVAAKIIYSVAEAIQDRFEPLNFSPELLYEEIQYLLEYKDKELPMITNHFAGWFKMGLQTQSEKAELLAKVSAKNRGDTLNSHRSLFNARTPALPARPLLPGGQNISSFAAKTLSIYADFILPEGELKQGKVEGTLKIWHTLRSVTSDFSSRFGVEIRLNRRARVLQMGDEDKSLVYRAVRKLYPDLFASENANVEFTFQLKRELTAKNLVHYEAAVMPRLSAISRWPMPSHGAQYRVRAFSNRRHYFFKC